MKYVDWVQNTPTSRDETAGYRVIIKKQNLTLLEFIDDLLSTKMWGYIKLKDGKNPWTCTTLCEYKWGEIIVPLLEEDRKKYGDMEIVSMDASGGWSRFDWYLEFKEE